MTSAIRLIQDPPHHEARDARASPIVGTFVRDGSRFAVLGVALDDGPMRALSNAEREVAELAIQGFGNADIARLRQTSVHTVANQMGSIFRKLEVASRCHLAARLALCPSRRGPW